MRSLSHRQFAAAAGVSAQAVSKWLGGGHISPERWSRVATAAGLTVPELLGVDPSAQNPADDGEALQLLRRLTALADAPMDRAVPDLMQVLRDAQRLVGRA
jgi:transcriptional regulator with XRE-family HTH domain